MKNILLAFTAVFLSTFSANAQSKLGPTEKKINDALCDCIARQDLSKITSAEQATAIYTDCVGERSDLLMQLAAERKVEVTDVVAMRELGLEIGKNLLLENCAAALKLGVKMNTTKKAENAGAGVDEGSFKRMDNKGFNYVVITDQNKNEKSFLWLKQFQGSEKFMNNTALLVNKKVKINWQEVEVYLPQAKGYYKVKEITSIEFL